MVQKLFRTGFRPSLAESLMKYTQKKKRKYTNKSEQIFEMTGTSNWSIILESRNSESFSLSGPHILGHLCIKTKFLGIFLSTLNVSILKRSLRRSLCKMPKFFVSSVNVFCLGNNSEIKLCKFYFYAHLLYFYMANWLST